MNVNTLETTLPQPQPIVIDGVRYRAIERKAKVGEKVLIVSAYRTYGMYRNGDTFEVECAHGDGIFTSNVVTDENPNGFIADEEYLVLEPIEDEANIKYDVVNHPRHYNAGRYEAIDVISDVVDVMAKAGASGAECYAIGNVLRYVMRYRLKNGVEDLRKAKWYIDKAIQEFREENKC